MVFQFAQKNTSQLLHRFNGNPYLKLFFVTSLWKFNLSPTCVRINQFNRKWMHLVVNYLACPLHGWKVSSFPFRDLFCFYVLSLTTDDILFNVTPLERQRYLCSIFVPYLYFVIPQQKQQQQQQQSEIPMNSSSFLCLLAICGFCHFNFNYSLTIMKIVSFGWNTTDLVLLLLLPSNISWHLMPNIFEDALHS